LSLLNIRNFKGLMQNVSYTDMPLSYSPYMENLDVDRPVGTLKIRQGHAKKYSDAYTNILAAYEYYFEKSDETKLLINDSGTLKVTTDGGAPSSLTMPTGPGATATLASSFRCQFFGWKDHVIITTGNGATNYVLGYYYVNRVNADNTGLFGNNEQSTGYKFLKSQLICPNGVFSMLNYTSAAYVDSHWFLPIRTEPNAGCKWIEKRDVNFQLIERIKAYDDATDLLRICLCTDGTHIFMGTDDGVYKIDPNGWIQLASQTGGPTNVLDICVDDTYVYTVNATRLDRLAKTDLSLGGNPDDTLTSGSKITCDATYAAGAGKIYIYSNGNVRRRVKNALTVDTHTYAKAGIVNLHLDSYNSEVLAADSTTVYELDPADITLDTSHTNVDTPYLFLDNGSAVRCFSRSFGVVQDYDGYTVRFPELITICERTTLGSGALETGTYFYKISIIDQDGQEYTLSDPIHANVNAAAKKVLLRIVITGQINAVDPYIDFYRVSHINIYRAYNDEASNDAESPATDYKFLKKIDINSSGWTNDANLNIYYYDYDDNTVESEISSVTFFESSGIEDTVKPRYINYKYLEFIGSKLHCANFSHDGDDFPNRIIRSPDDAPDAISFYDYYDFDVGEGDVIKDIASANDRSIIFKTLKFGVFYEGSHERTFIPGIASEKAWCKKDEILYFISNQGIHVFDGIKVNNIKDPVITYFDAGIWANSAAFHVEKLNRLIFTGRGSRTLVYNYKYNLWMYYSYSEASEFAFVGYFKNQDDEYIAYNTTTFYEIFNDSYVNDKEDVGGGNGTNIGIVYESAIIKPTNFEGRIIIPISHRHRLLKGSETINLYTYRYDTSGETLIDTKALSAPGGSVEAVKSYFFDREIGESFKFKIQGNVTGGDFEHHGLTLEYEIAEHFYV